MNCALHAVSLLLVAAPALLQAQTIGPYPLPHATPAFEAPEPMGGAGGAAGRLNRQPTAEGPSHA